MYVTGHDPGVGVKAIQDFTFWRPWSLE